MKIGGYVKNSLVDFPHNIACTIFTVGCNMGCWYCHNKHILTYKKFIAEEEIFNYIKSAMPFLDGVVISGGEPTLQPDLTEFIKKVKGLGLKVKLDTNGTNFILLKNLVQQNLLDYVAIDIKAPFEKYNLITQTDDDIDSIKKCVQFLIDGAIDYEFRTTFSPDMSVQDVADISKIIKGAKKYALQKYREVDNDKNLPLHTKEDFEMASALASKNVAYVELRGL